MENQTHESSGGSSHGASSDLDVSMDFAALMEETEASIKEKLADLKLPNLSPVKSLSPEKSPSPVKSQPPVNPKEDYPTLQASSIQTSINAGSSQNIESSLLPETPSMNTRSEESAQPHSNQLINISSVNETVSALPTSQSFEALRQTLPEQCNVDVISDASRSTEITSGLPDTLNQQAFVEDLKNPQELIEDVPMIQTDDAEPNNMQNKPAVTDAEMIVTEPVMQEDVGKLSDDIGTSSARSDLPHLVCSPVHSAPKMASTISQSSSPPAAVVESAALASKASIQPATASISSAKSSAEAAMSLVETSVTLSALSKDDNTGLDSKLPSCNLIQSDHNLTGVGAEVLPAINTSGDMSDSQEAVQLDKDDTKKSKEVDPAESAEIGNNSDKSDPLTLETKRGDKEDVDHNRELDVESNRVEPIADTLDTDCTFEEGSFMITDVRSLSDCATDESSLGEIEQPVKAQVGSTTLVPHGSTAGGNQSTKRPSSVKSPVDENITRIAVKKKIISVTLDQLDSVKRAAKTNEGHIPKKQKVDNLSSENISSLSQSSVCNSQQACSASNSVNNNSVLSGASKGLQPSLVAVKQEPLENIDTQVSKSNRTLNSTVSNKKAIPKLRNNSTPVKLLHGKKLIPTTTVDAQKKLIMQKVSNSSPAIAGTLRIVSSGTTQGRPVEIVLANSQTPLCTIQQLTKANQLTTIPTAVKIAPKIPSSTSHEVDSVGIGKITELISRKNPLPVYKPIPIPEIIKKDVTLKVYTCYECGDTYLHSNSLSIHTNRCSMKITYNCDNCGKVVHFTNKCQLLGHLRSHLNIALTHAVPIHIKSDSIKIKSVYEDLVNSDSFEWYKGMSSTIAPATFPPAIAVNGGTKTSCICWYCKQTFDNLEAREQHFAGKVNQENTLSYLTCTKCPLAFLSKCALSAHEDLHKLLESCSFSVPTANSKTMHVCPECGRTFANRLLFMDHVFRNCYHFSKRIHFKCTKCSADIGSSADVNKHLIASLEQYYKCDLCPMAFKKVQTFVHHFAMKHEAGSAKGAKIIYRCHICNTLIDDRKFLMTHLMKHCLEIQKDVKFRNYCLQCAQLFETKDALKAHDHHGNYMNRKKCRICYANCNNQFHFGWHVLTSHTISKSEAFVQFCDFCGLVCLSVKMLKTHVCLSGGPIKVIGDRPVVGNAIGAPGSSLELNEANKKNYTVFAANPKAAVKFYKCSSCLTAEFSSPAELKSHIILCTAMIKQQKSGDKLQTEKPQKASKKSPSPSSGRSSASQVVEEDKMFGRVKLKPKPGQRKSIEDQTVFFPCDKCDQVFTRKSKQELHLKEEHGLHACLLCGLIYESQSNLKRHLRLDHEGKRLVYYCYICRKRKILKSFMEKAALEKHLEKKHRMKTFDQTKLVPELPGLEQEERNSNMPAHLKRKESDNERVEPVKKLKIEGETTFNCAKCVFTCDNKDDFLDHISQHKANNSVQCLECGLCFIVLNSLQKHLFIVHKVRDFETYMKENDIKSPEPTPEPEKVSEDVPVESSEEEEESPLECKVCYKQFDTEDAKNRHMRVHGMAFIRKSTRRSLPKKSNLQNKNEDGNIMNDAQIGKDVCQIQSDNCKTNKAESGNVDTLEQGILKDDKRDSVKSAIDKNSKHDEMINKTDDLKSTTIDNEKSSENKVKTVKTNEEEAMETVDENAMETDKVKSMEINEGKAE